MVEAEYIGFLRAVMQALWISKYLGEIGLPTSRPIMIHADNNRSISHSLNDKNHWRTKYIDIQHHFVKDQVKLGNITFQYIPSSNNIADLFTKPLPQEKICQFTSGTQSTTQHQGCTRPGGVMKWSSSNDGVWFDMRLGDVDVRLSQFKTV